VHMVAWEHGPPHGEMVRFDTAGEDTAFKLLYSRMDPAGGRSGMGYGFQALVNTRTGHRSVFSNTQPAPDTWHHVAMTYDGTALSLYVNGALAGSTPGAGAVNPTWLPLAMGAAGDGTGHFQGQIDEMRLHSRALAAEEVLAQAQRRKYASPEPVAGAPGAEETR